MTNKLQTVKSSLEKKICGGNKIQETKLNCVQKYRQTSNINHTLVGNNIADHSDAVGASPVGAAPTASSFAT